MPVSQTRGWDGLLTHAVTMTVLQVPGSDGSGYAGAEVELDLSIGHRVTVSSEEDKTNSDSPGQWTTVSKDSFESKMPTAVVADSAGTATFLIFAWQTGR